MQQLKAPLVPFPTLNRTTLNHGFTTTPTTASSWPTSKKERRSLPRSCFSHEIRRKLQRQHQLRATGTCA
ncbi:unnamed protein product [Amoebophrya sp. A25]|nr:unnamed protein product [Amoebophrya sp. A25]|eukprot:GSA25T00006293001.1